MAKADGLYITIVFDYPITSVVADCAIGAFAITAQEYTYVPGGTLHAVTYTPTAIEAHPTVDNAIRLTFADGEGSVRNAAGEITVAYDDTVGDLAGSGGPVAAFSTTFSPADLVAKPDVNDPEHIEIAVTATGVLLVITYLNAKEEESIEISVSASGTLTHVNDL